LILVTASGSERKRRGMELKPKVAIYNLGGCNGCDEAVFDINKALLDISEDTDMVFWPLLLDHKYPEIEKMKAGEITLSILNGNVRNSDQETVARLLREKSQLVLAFGSCACFGGTPGLANLTTKAAILDWAYRDAPSIVNPEGWRPAAVTEVDGGRLTLPELYNRVYSLNKIIVVDYYLPGCPPPPQLVLDAINAVLKHKLPHKGSTLAPYLALCDTCERNKTKPERLALKKIKRIHQIEADTDDCFLTQGVLCFGPVTRGGCGESCLHINMPCRGCFGPVEGITDAGTKFIAALATLIEAESEEQLAERIDRIADTVGYLYRFSLPLLQLRPSPTK
jgi:F420-non-reducing hydrogenase small subunit